MRYAIVAAVLSLVFAVAAHVYDCQSGTHEQCLVSAGFFWVYWVGSFLLAWPIIASFGMLIRSLKDMTKR